MHSKITTPDNTTPDDLNSEGGIANSRSEASIPENSQTSDKHREQSTTEKQSIFGSAYTNELSHEKKGEKNSFFSAPTQPTPDLLTSSGALEENTFNDMANFKSNKRTNLVSPQSAIQDTEAVNKSCCTIF